MSFNGVFKAYFWKTTRWNYCYSFFCGDECTAFKPDILLLKEKVISDIHMSVLLCLSVLRLECSQQRSRRRRNASDAGGMFDKDSVFRSF